MLNQILNQKIIIFVAIMCGIGFFVKWMLHHTYKRLLHASSDIGHSPHCLMKTLCMKFEACYKLKMGVPNVSLFVEKYLRHYHVFGMNIKTWEHVNMFSIILVMAACMGNSIWNMMQGNESIQVFLPLFAGVIGTAFLLLIDSVWNTENQWKLLQIDITDYLENICKPRLENENFHPEELLEYQKQYFSKEENVVDFETKEEKEAIKEKILPEFSFTAEEEEVIREVIHEYLG